VGSLEAPESDKRVLNGVGPYRYTFTVFTATYNRSRTLHRVYESLSRQTFRDFEWLVVDDGSTDKTNEMVEGWRQEAGFPIRYFWQTNQGKHVASNRAVAEAEGEFFVILDSDDACVPEGLERLKHHWDSIPESSKGEFSGVTVLCKDENGQVVGDRFPRDVTDSGLLEMLYRYKVKGDKWGFRRTDVLRMYPFPTVPGEAFVPQGTVWFAIAQNYRTRFVNEALHVDYCRDAASSDRLSRQRSPSKHAKGNALMHRCILNHNIDWFWYAPHEFLRSAVHYSRFSFHAGQRLVDQVKNLDNALARVLWAVMLPVGLCVYLRDRIWISS
jgi:glycosyltransferase involved in cell wall biosynthesis